MGRGSSSTSPPPSRRRLPSPGKSAAAAAEWTAKESLLFNDEESPFRAAIDRHDPGLVVVTGENASGKSLFARIAAAAVQKEGRLPVSVSIRERTGAGSSGGGGLRRVMMFGDEQEQSTGATSVKVLETAFKNLDRDGGSMLILDEPELGLSEAYARALGELIGLRSLQAPQACIGVMVVSHSRPLIQGLLQGSGKEPSHVACAAEQEPEAGLERWLDSSEHHSVDELLDLREVGHHRWKRVVSLLKSD
jgi:hypothetical protein